MFTRSSPRNPNCSGSVGSIEVWSSFGQLRPRIVDEPGPERLKMSILPEEKAL
jgi:uncharacterized membrane protein